MNVSISYRYIQDRVAVIVRLAVLFVSLFAIWYVVMLLISWYDPVMHTIATASSVLMTLAGGGWGILNRIVS